MYARLFYLLHIIFNFLKGYIMSKTTNQILIDFLDFKIAMLKGEVAVCEEMRTELIKNEDSPVLQNIFSGDIQPEMIQSPTIESSVVIATDPQMTTPISTVIATDPQMTTPISTACSIPHWVD